MGEDVSLEKQDLRLFEKEIAKQWQSCKQSIRISEFQRDQLALLFRYREHVRNGRALIDVSKNTANLRQKGLVKLAMFLWEYEVSYMYLVNSVCHILILNGHDLFDLFKRKYTISMKEIAEVDSSTKLKFLKEHKFGMIIREQDRKLRNKIAHGGYMLNDDGRLVIEGKDENIGSRLIALLEFESKTEKILTKFVDEEFK